MCVWKHPLQLWRIYEFRQNISDSPILSPCLFENSSFIAANVRIIKDFMHQSLASVCNSRFYSQWYFHKLTEINDTRFIVTLPSNICDYGQFNLCVAPYLFSSRRNYVYSYMYTYQKHPNDSFDYYEFPFGCPMRLLQIQIDIHFVGTSNPFATARYTPICVNKVHTFLV